MTFSPIAKETEMPTTDQPTTHTNPHRPCAEVAVGDVIVFLGTRYPITRIDEYPEDSPLHAAQAGPLPHGTRIVRSGAPRWEGDEGWGMTLPPNGSIEVIA